jgi:transcriptional regulator with XRE-family HTH domain
MNTTTKTDNTRLREFGAFLRSWRERLTPTQVGLPDGERRRTPGLRREEVAQLAGVGNTWYTWLEQGRDVNASAEALLRLAQALRLDDTEKRLLFDLAGKPRPVVRPCETETVPESLLRMLESLTGQPALVIGRRWDVLAWNRAAVALFGDYARLEGDERNIMALVFSNEEHRLLLVDWEEVARVSLAMFRADTARFVGDPDFERLIAFLTRSSPEFRAWWPQRDVVRKLSSPKRIFHRVCGAMAFENVSLAVLESGDLKLVVYTPLDECGTVGKLQALLEYSI